MSVESELIDLNKKLDRLIRAVDGVTTAIITRDPQTPKGASNVRTE